LEKFYAPSLNAFFFSKPNPDEMRLLKLFNLISAPAFHEVKLDCSYSLRLAAQTLAKTQQIAPISSNKRLFWVKNYRMGASFHIVNFNELMISKVVAFLHNS
jgi:hypothetical protein